MNQNLKMFHQKIKNRQFSIDNSGRVKRQNALEQSEQPESQNQLLWRVLEENLSEAGISKDLRDGYFPLYSHHKKIGSVIVFWKKAVRKLLKIFLGWYLFPLYQRQSHFNGKVLNAVSIARDMISNLESRVDELQRANGQLLEELRIREQALRQADGQLAKKTDALAEHFTREAARQRQQAEQLKEQLRRIENLPTEDNEFYHQFEERFRGARDEIKDRLQVYVPMIKEHLPDWTVGTFVDIGSGRGEWLDILRDNGAVNYVGIDLNARQNAICESFGHKTVCLDCIKYLSEQQEESVDLITGIQIIEHLCMSDVVELLKQSHRVLKRGGVILLETQNPRNIIVGADTFYIDPSHKRPLEPRMMEFIVEWCGFKNVNCMDANSGPASAALPLPSETHENYELIRQFNDIKWILFGPQDYAIFAVKE